MCRSLRRPTRLRRSAIEMNCKLTPKTSGTGKIAATGGLAAPE
jgi:hypothetical protein